MSEQLEQPKDPMIKFRAVKRGKNKKGGDRTELYLSKEETAVLLTSVADLADNERGVKLDLHISERTTDDGRKFDSAIIFLKRVQERDAAQRGGTVRDAEALAAKVEKIKAELKSKT